MFFNKKNNRTRINDKNSYYKFFSKTNSIINQSAHDKNVQNKRFNEQKEYVDDRIEERKRKFERYSK